MAPAWWKRVLLLVSTVTLTGAQSGIGSGSDHQIPYIALFDATEYEFDINIYSPIGTVVFEPLFIINPNVTVEYLSFDIIMMDETVEESSVDGEDFLINGTTPPLVIQQVPFQSMYTLPIITGRVLDTNDTMDITFRLVAYVRISSNLTGTFFSNVTLHRIDPCDECVSNSTCEPQNDGSVNCVCPTGYNGRNCSNYIGMCIPNPCMNNGSCQDILGSFTCSCPPPLSGRLCETVTSVDNVDDDDDDDDDDSVILYTGCGILIIFLLFTMVLLLLFRKKSFNKVKDFVHFNVSLSLLLSSIIFIVGIEATNEGSVACIVLGALLHYTLLSALFWVLCDGILIYILLYHVFYEGFFKKWIFFMIIGWGIPAPIVGISIGIFSHEEYETNEGCWLSEDEHAIWGFIVPVALIILVVFCFIPIFLWKICKTDIHYLTNSRERKFNMAKDLLKLIVILLPILSSTWIVGLFAVNRSSVVYSYIFAALKVFQGIFIFSFYIILPYIKILHNKDDYDSDDGAADDDNIESVVRVEEDKAIKGYRFSFAPGIAGKKVTVKRASASKVVAQKKATELVRRQSLSEYNETVRSEYTSSSTEKEDQSKVKTSNPFNTIVEEPNDQTAALAVDKVKITENASKDNDDLQSKDTNAMNDETEYEDTKL